MAQNYFLWVFSLIPNKDAPQETLQYVFMKWRHSSKCSGPTDKKLSGGLTPSLYVHPEHVSSRAYQSRATPMGQSLKKDLNWRSSTGLLWPKPMNAELTYRLAINSMAATVTLIFIKTEIYDEQKVTDFLSISQWNSIVLMTQFFGMHKYVHDTSFCGTEIFCSSKIHADFAINLV